MDKVKYFEGIESYKLLAKKEVGQNFLIDYVACERIVNLISPHTNETLLEIGCGAGSLTYFLSQFENEIDVIDIDEAMLAKVEKDFEHITSMHVKYGNATEYDYSNYDYIIGNLPYYITSLIIEKVLKSGSNLKKCVFMVQKEAASRLLSSIGSKDYGPLPILISLSCKAKREFNVGRNSFAPAPNVDSTVISFDFSEEVNKEVAYGTFKLCEKLFLQRRKTLSNNLKRYFGEEIIQRIFTELKLKPTVRPEELSPEDFKRIYLITENKKQERS